MALDETLLKKALEEPEGLSRREWAHLKSVSSSYSKQDFPEASRLFECHGIPAIKRQS